MSHSFPTVQNDFPAPEDGGAQTWLEANSSETRKSLLAFAYDGVIWGEYTSGLKTSTSLNEETLQQAFLFGEKDELRLFRGEDEKWKACLITDGSVAPEDKIDEIQVLWGNEVAEPMNSDGFTRVHDRIQQAMDHSLPLDLNGLDLNAVGPRLLVRHFIKDDDQTGEAHIFLSRLVKLDVGPLAEEKFK